MRGYDDLTETVRRGRTLLDGAGVVDPEDAVWVALDWPQVLEVARENAAAAGVAERCLRVTPRDALASFALMMLGATVAGDAYPFSVYEEIFRKAGFARTDLHPVVPHSPQQLMVSVRD